MFLKPKKAKTNTCLNGMVDIFCVTGIENVCNSYVKNTFCINTVLSRILVQRLGKKRTFPALSAEHINVVQGPLTVLL